MTLYCVLWCGTLVHNYASWCTNIGRVCQRWICHIATVGPRGPVLGHSYRYHAVRFVTAGSQELFFMLAPTRSAIAGPQESFFNILIVAIRKLARIILRTYPSSILCHSWATRPVLGHSYFCGAARCVELQNHSLSLPLSEIMPLLGHMKHLRGLIFSVPSLLILSIYYC
jgi:hypothetical protein